MPRGFDVGTYTLVHSRRDEKGDIKSKKEINAFLEVSLDNPYTYNMLNKADVKLIKRENVAYVVGEAAVNMAYTLNLELKRPMKDGCLNPKEKDAYNILSRMILSMIGEIEGDKDILYYSVPANAINQETDADFHQKVLEDIFKKYNVGGKAIEAHSVNEGLALVFAELGNKNYTGIGVSCGAGMVNLCYAIFSQPVFATSIVNSGDWIDKQAAKACAESPVVINKEKMKIDLGQTPKNMMERAIMSQYRIMIEKTIVEIKKAIDSADIKVRSQEPINIVLAGGTASPPGFVDLFTETIKSANLPLPLGEITRPDDCLYAVSRGCLIAAENALIA